MTVQRWWYPAAMPGAATAVDGPQWRKVVIIMGQVYFPTDHTPDEWRTMAQRGRDSERESFERCDTDGFMSQWASAIMAQLYDVCAQVAERGGVWDFPALADADGNLIDGAREVHTRYGWAWVMPGDRWFNPSRARDEATRQAHNLRKGFQVITVTRPAVVAMVGGEGALTVRPVVLQRRADD